MIRTTRPQREALARVFDRSYDDNATQPPIHPVNHRRWLRGYRAFRKTVQPGPGCIMVQWSGMWLGIEPDGYTHSLRGPQRRWPGAIPTIRDAILHQKKGEFKSVQTH